MTNLFTLNDLVSEFGFEENSFDELKDLVKNCCAQSFKEKLEHNSDVEEDFSPSVIVKRFSLEKINEFLKQNPDFHNEETSDQFDFSALGLSEHKDNYFSIIENEIYVVSF